MPESTVSEGSKKRTDLTRQTLKIFWQHARAYSFLMLVCAVGIAIAIGCDLASPVASRKLFNLLGLDRIRRTQLGNIAGIRTAIAYIIALSFGSWVGGRLYMYALSLFESRTMKTLADTCYAYTQNHSYRFFSNNFGGALVTRNNRFVAAFEVIADQCTLQLGQTVIRITLIIGILFWYNPSLGWIFLAWALTLISFNIGFSKYKLKFDRARAEMDTKVTARLSDTITNAVNLKLFAAADRETNSFRELTQEHWKARYTSWKMGEYSQIVQGFSMIILQGVILSVSVEKWLRGTLTLGDVVMLQSIFGSS